MINEFENKQKKSNSNLSPGIKSVRIESESAKSHLVIIGFTNLRLRCYLIQLPLAVLLRVLLVRKLITLLGWW